MISVIYKYFDLNGHKQWPGNPGGRGRRVLPRAATPICGDFHFHLCEDARSI